MCCQAVRQPAGEGGKRNWGLTNKALAVMTSGDFNDLVVMMQPYGYAFCDSSNLLDFNNLTCCVVGSALADIDILCEYYWGSNCKV